MTVMTVRYEWQKGSRVKADAEAAAKQFEALRERDGTVGLEAVIEENRSEAAPLHNEFEWHDPTAAHMFRLHQAGHVVRTLRRVTVDLKTEEEQPPERIYVPVRAAEQPDEEFPVPTAQYVPVAVAASGEEQGERLRAHALDRIARLEAELRSVPACADLAEALGTIVERYNGLR